ncbi:hypothetical protein [Fulvivirga sedimenti]|uniref:Uncharacterized protein n=1 Tax=Fulvivirga sedimenti TaxID=2879465 RepID=A0A9X1L1T7_9BACT|nr:hypothetical protein [Fulvivirga sedimenti]MCA6075096.1 hypothetical protein [Fulvivirga sedimenti]MCA6076273.1 hypothetical protein [Fulvivirga sedimenti]MCA6077401.1 hypothetical protein [Fulvivirga sedimenti]
MLKLFRKDRLKLLSENRISKYLVYATGEIILVVIGILIALQINSMYAESVRLAAGNQARNRLAQDLRSDQEIYAIRTRYFMEALAFGEKALPLLNGDPEALNDPWESVYAAYQASQIWPFRPKDQTYVELQNAGNLDLIGGPLVQDVMASYYKDAQEEIGITFGGPDFYRKMIRERTPWRIQRYIWENCYSFEQVANTATNISESAKYLPACPPPPNSDDVLRTAQALSGDPELANALRGRLAELHVTLSYIRNRQAEVDSLLIMVRNN